MTATPNTGSHRSPLNREVFATDPDSLELLNHGVAEVKGGRTEAELRTLRYELSTFVCQGQYELGLRKVLDTYLANVGKTEQPGIWVSGFFGSGKSHFLKVLRALWTNEPFADGTQPRGLSHLTPEINDVLRELTTRGKQNAGLHAAAGTLGASARSVRLGILSIAFRSVGLPERYDLASFVMWLRDHGCLDAVKAAVEAEGSIWDEEIHDFLVSPVIHEAVAAHFPKWTTPVGGIGTLLHASFPDRDDVSNEDMVAAIRKALTRDGKFPLTLLAIDEVQQFIGDNSERAHMVQEAAEECCKRFGSSLLIIGTGQSAMASTPQLLKLKGRFPIEVQLSDADVDTVVRQIVLRKRPDRTAAVRDVLEKHNGEISKHLAGSQIGPRPEDKDVLVSDYPLLPVRRRFWEHALRAVDVGGTTVQLRNQLRVVYEAVRSTAAAPLGTVIPADFLYFQLAPTLLQTSVLPREVHELVGRLHQSPNADDTLKARLVALVFLIGKLPRDASQGGDLGVRADAETLADLLVQNLEHGGAEVRKSVPAALQVLVDAGQLMQVETEYRVQTRESAAWEADFQKHRKALSDDDTKVSTARSEALAAAAKRRLGNISPTHGAAKVSRKVVLSFGTSSPKVEAGTVPVWVRDAWAESESTIQIDAVKAGNESSLVFVLLPNRGADEIKKALVTLKAAETTLQTRGMPSNEEGNLARAAVETRRDRAKERLVALLDEVIDHAQVIQAGGNEITDGSVPAAVVAAVKNAQVRLFPKFAAGDHAKWDAVLKKARAGDASALTVIGFHDNADKHPVCHEVLSFTAASQSGAEIRKHFESPPYGWSGDAVDGALYVLIVNGHLRASTGAGAPLTADSLDRAKIGLSKFRAETDPPTPQERIGVRQLMQKAGLPCKSNEEIQYAPALVAELKRRAAAAGGEPPAPAAPSTAHLLALDGLPGNALVKQLYKAKDELLANIDAWDKLATAIQSRLLLYGTLEALLAVAGTLPVAQEVAIHRDALRDGRALLTKPDPLPHLCEQITTALREALVSARDAWKAVYDGERAGLMATDAWAKLAEERREGLLVKHGIATVPPLTVGTRDEVLRAAEARSPSQWTLDQAGLPSRFAAARLDAIQLVAPKAQAVTLPQATLHTESELQVWLDKARAVILAKLADGPVVV
ncbi:MAG: BREX system P-loop protein BrxC [Nannocystis sp.]|nr:BREX system P-loop protein BrxC [Nannocystis sp.]